MFSEMGMIGIGVLLGLASAGLGFLFFYKTPEQEPNGLLQKGEGPVFLFDDEVMLDCNSAARAILSRSTTQGGDWPKLLSFLSKYFQDIDQKLTALGAQGAFAESALSQNGKLILLQAELNAGLTKITLADPDITEGVGVAVAMSHRAMQDELENLNKMIASAPVLIWRESPQGLVTWGNNGYVLAAAAVIPFGQEISWPLPRLFERNSIVQSTDRQRLCLTPKQGKGAWFDLVTEADGDDLLCYATPIDAAVTAENNLRDFMQTLSKTFAQLPIGLAIFDKDRKLQMFNPALSELTTLPPDLLIRRPTMFAVLDAMRERNLLPEPKDYNDWRRQVTEIERAAAAGLFQENWALPDGQSFRVSARPHPNGGLALMIEDISNEMHRSRRYRSDLEISQSVIDQLDDAIVVFGLSGQFMWCNTAYSKLWSHDPACDVADITIREATDQWRALAAPTPLWRELDEYIHTVGLRQPWSKELRLCDGRLLSCVVAPTAAGSTMIAFKHAPHKAAIPPNAVAKPNLVAKPSGKATAAR